jgi:hypothetical protein
MNTMQMQATHNGLSAYNLELLVPTQTDAVGTSNLQQNEAAHITKHYL